MANNLHNLRHDGLNYAQHPNNTDQSTCRLCNQAFRSTQALITHIESHMAHEEVAIRRLYSPDNINSQRQLASHRFAPSFPMPMQLQEIQNFAGNNSIFQAPSQPMVMPQPRRNPFFSAGQVRSSTPIRQMRLSPQILSSAGKNNAAETAQLLTPQFHQRKPAEESSTDGTKAYIMQLEKPIKKIAFIDLVNMDDDNSDVQPLNLELKL